jgi:RimJ/RimL family protein N-acetyltransferase
MPHGCSVPDTLFETERLRLRRFRESDRAGWTAHMNTPEVRAHLGGVKTREESGGWFDAQKDSWTDAAGGFLVVERKSDELAIGACGFGPIEADEAPAELRGAPEIGWSLRADCWGHGYATEAAAGLLDAMFERWGHAAVYSQTSEANQRSWRVMERLGLTRLPHLDYIDPLYPPEENPTKIYGITRAQWAARR